MPVTVRRAREADAPALINLIDALAEYEHLAPPDADAKQRLVRDMFTTPPRIEALLCEVDGQPAGYALIIETYSSFLALPTLYLEDLFVLPSFRNRKAGYALFSTVAREAVTRGCGRMEWTVLDWNELAIGFYKKIGASHMKEWDLYRLTRKELEHLVGPNTVRSSP
jgi:GNAT superfamily N-acetyltransferase